MLSSQVHWAQATAFFGLLFILGLGSWLAYDRFTALGHRVSDLASSTELLTEQTARLQRDLSEAQQRTVELSDTLYQEQQKLAEVREELGDFEEDIGDISGTVTTLEKLSKTDPELLQKYSRVFFLNEHYEPPRLKEIPDEYKYDEDRMMQIHAQVWPYLEDLLEEAQDDDIELYVFSAYRSFGTQSALNDSYTVTYGAGTANQFSADQGYSEHQLGTTIDLITTGIGGTLEGFGDTEAYEWLLDNAHEYGFVLSYPPGNDYYIFEPWHWRFVGVELAEDLHDDNEHFYDLEQREIDKYLPEIFD